MSKEPVSNTGGAGGAKSEDPTVITIAVVVCYDENRVVRARVTDPVYLSPRTPQKVRWCVYNNLDVPLTSVSIGAFTSGVSTAASLCSNTPKLTTGPIPPGNTDAACTEFCATTISASGTSFQYTVTVKPENQTEVDIRGPRVIIQ